MKFEIDSDEEFYMEGERVPKEDLQYLVNTLYKKEFEALKRDAEAKLDDMLYLMLNGQDVEETYQLIYARDLNHELPDRDCSTPCPVSKHYADQMDF